MEGRVLKRNQDLMIWEILSSKDDKIRRFNVRKACFGEKSKGVAKQSFASATEDL